IEKLNQRYYNLIITDTKMPKMDGLTFVENIRRDVRFKQKPIIAVFSKEDDDTKEKYLDAGVSSFIVKSEFDRGNLVDEVKKLIG
ncbi:response regulator, partial [Spirochaetota bacterium]